jgi:hypothetical protein
VTNRAEGEDVAEPDEGENEPLKLRKTAADNTLFVFGMPRFKYKRCQICDVMFRNGTVRTSKGL